MAFVKNRKYRVPMFLATSFERKIATQFAARSGGDSAVLWEVEVDPEGKDDFLRRCKHVSFLPKSHVKTEKEFLFAPYSVFTVVSVKWSEPGDKGPHVIRLRAASDNADEPEDLPLAPWA